jgi:chemotaxis-related protein WspB
MLYLRFNLGQDRYIIDTQFIVAVVPLLAMKKKYTISGRNPTYVAGVVQFRDQTVPVLDLTKLMSGRESQPYMSTRIVLTEFVADSKRYQLVGLIVEKATEVVKLNDGKLSSTANNMEESLSYGPAVRDSEGFLMCLDIQKLLELKVFDNRGNLITGQER